MIKCPEIKKSKYSLKFKPSKSANKVILEKSQNGSTPYSALNEQSHKK